MTNTPQDHGPSRNGSRPGPRNVLGGKLEPCGTDPLTGFYRDGCCNTGPEDLGLHTVCAVVTAEFLAFSAAHGPDPATAHASSDVAGLSPGDRWCLCAAQWHEAYQAGVAPPVVLEATHERAAELVPLAALHAHAAEPPPD